MALRDVVGREGTATVERIKEQPAPREDTTAVHELRREVKEWFQGFSPGGATAIAAGLLACVAAADVYAGPGVDLTLLYLGPIGFGTIFAGLRAGAALSALAALGSLEASRIAGERLPGAVVAWNAAQQLGIFLLLAAVVDAFKKRLLHEQQAARTDPLTGVANRRAFVEAAWLEMERSRRHGRPLSLLYLDCDDFKAVNDRLGHVGGDEVLAAVGGAVRDAVRAHDTVARLGGDEFGVLLPEIDSAGAIALAERLRTRLRGSPASHGITFSIGIATFLTPPSSVDEMILRADHLMYEAKRSGKNAWRAEVAGPPAGVA